MSAEQDGPAYPEMGPHATTTPNGTLQCVHGVPTAHATKLPEGRWSSTTLCPWFTRLTGHDPIELWEKHGAHAHGVQGPLYWSPGLDTIMGGRPIDPAPEAAPEAVGADPRSPISPMAATRLQSAIAMLQRVEYDAVTVTEHSPGQVVVRVAGAPDEAWTTLTVVQEPMPDAAGSHG